MKRRNIQTQVLIIGGGIIGTAIARELSRYKVDVTLVEKEPAVGFGITKGAQGLIHGGVSFSCSRLVKRWDPSGDLKEFLSQPLRRKEKLNLRGRKIYQDLAPLLNARLLQCGRIVVAENDEDLTAIRIMKEVAEQNGFHNITLVDKAGLAKLEPALDKRFIGGLFDPNEQSILPIEWNKAFADNALDNGAHIHLNTRIDAVEERAGAFHLTSRNREVFETRFVINAAGLFSDEIASMAGPINWNFFLWKSHQLLLENRDYIHHVICGVHKPQKPRQLVPTPDGNIAVETTMYLTEDKYDFSTTREGLEVLGTYPRFFVPAVSIKRDLVTSWVGCMHFNTRDPEDYIIEWPRERFLNLIVCAPGLGPAPALAQDVVKMLGERGLELVRKTDFLSERPKEPRFAELSTEEKNRKIRQEPRYGRVVCRCELVTEQEIRNAAHKGAKTLDEIKFQTRAGMGRCQGGFCTSRVLGIMAETMGGSPLDITKKGGNSWVLKCGTKDLRGTL